MRPHHLLEACLRLFALNELTMMPLSVAAAAEQWDVVQVLHVAMTGYGLGLPTIGHVLLLVYAPKLCRWLHEAGADPGRTDAAPTRIALLRIGVALIGVEHLVWSVYNAKGVVLSLAGWELDLTHHVVYGGIQLIVGMILVFAAHRIARVVDGWGGGPSPPRIPIRARPTQV